MSNHIKEAIIEYWGERCNGYSEGCPVCAAWQELDALEAENAKLRQQVEFVKRIPMRHERSTMSYYCPLCDEESQDFCGDDKSINHHPDCPHAEAT